MTCTRCRNDWHEGCDGGAWTDDMQPAPCNCWMYGHKRYVVRDYDDRSDHAAELYEHSRDKWFADA